LFNNGGEGLGYHDDGPYNRGVANDATVPRQKEGVDLEKCSDAGGGYDVAYITPGEWMAYTLSSPKDTGYDIAIRYSSGTAGDKKCHLEIDRVNVRGTITLPSSNGWQTWINATVTGVHIPAGLHELRIVAEAPDYNFNYFDITYSDHVATIHQLRENGALHPGIRKLHGPNDGARSLDITTVGNSAIAILSLDGKTVYSRTINADGAQEAVWTAPAAGIFFVKIQSRAGNIMQKMILR
jgi:hypothetical protein